MAIYSADQKENKINTDGTIADLLITKLFLYCDFEKLETGNNPEEEFAKRRLPTVLKQNQQHPLLKGLRFSVQKWSNYFCSSFIK